MPVIFTKTLPSGLGVMSLPARRARRSTDIRGLIVALALLGLVSASARGQQLDKAVLDQAKDSTVFIKMRHGKMGGSGSGFVMKSVNDKLLVMTNRHVAVPDFGDDDSAVKTEVSVVFRSGTPQEQEVPGRVIAASHVQFRDLAVIEVSGVKNPPKILSPEEMIPEADFFETMQVISLGFPLGSMLQQMNNGKDGNPAVTVNIMSISRLPKDENNELNRIQLAGSLIQGNSGGPVINNKGKLVGVVVERINGENVGFAVSPSVVAKFLAGDLGEQRAQRIGASGALARMKIVATLVDPLKKMRSVTFRYIKLTSPPSPTERPDAQGNFASMANAKEIPLKMGPEAAAAEFDLPTATAEERKILYQWVAVDAAGRRRVTKPREATIPEREGYVNGFGEVSEREKKLAKWSCEGNLWDGVKIINSVGSTTIDMPGGMALVNAPQLKLYNSPYAMVRVDGDFVASVLVNSDFDPGGDAPVVNGKKYPFTFQGAGLLIWQDEKNFVRLERCKQSDGGLGLDHKILVEIYKNGKEAVFYKEIPEKPAALICRRKGSSIQFLFAMPPADFIVFQEIAIDFEKEVNVGISASNLSKRAFQAKLEDFSLKDLEGKPIEVKPAPMARLIDGGGIKQSDGTWVYEGAAFKVLRASNGNGTAEAQKNMDKYNGKWSDNRQLCWQATKKGDTLSLELTVDAEGKYDVRAICTQAAAYGKVRFSIDGKVLDKGKSVDFYAKEVKPVGPMMLGTMLLTKGKHKLVIDALDKNPSSSGFLFGLDELQLIPAR